MKVDRELLANARVTRHDMSPIEARLWYHLRDRRLNGVKFVRGAPRSNYILDFVPRSQKLIVEVDGDTHAGHEVADERRDATFELKGYRVLRFTNSDVMTNLDGVLQTIADALPHAPSPQPSPRKRGEGA